MGGQRTRGHVATGPRRPPGLLSAAYRLIFTGVLTKVDAERVHQLAGALIAAAGRVPPLRVAMSTLSGAHRGIGDGEGRVVLGRCPAGSLGLAAGFDKNATMVPGLAALGFTFIEVGTVTAHAQVGNDRPRLWRVPEQAALVNRMGFNNDGARQVAVRLRRLRRSGPGRRVVLGVNIGKSKVTPASEAVADYAFSARALAPYADYLVVNVSSPNTPGLRDLQQIDSLRPILQAVQRAAEEGSARHVPVLVKIAPDLADADVDAVAALARELRLAGVVAVNTTIDHNRGAGGMSGPPVRARGLQVVERLREQLDPGQVIIGVGGIGDPAHARAYLRAGADLVQAYAAFVYAGPTWPGQMNKALRTERT